MADDANIAITVYLTPAMKKRIDRACKDRGYSVTGFVRVAIEERFVRLAAEYDAVSKVAARG